MRHGFHSAIVDGHTIRLPFPSWSWASWGDAVSYYAKCEERVKSLVEWQPVTKQAIHGTKPLSYFCGLSSSDSTPALEPITVEQVTITEQELGFLRFTAESVTLHIKAEEPSIADSHGEEESGNENCTEGHPESESDHTDEQLSERYVYCQIINALGRSIGGIGVPQSWLLGGDTRCSEFLLLSACIERISSDVCQQILKDNHNYPEGPTSVGIKHIDGCEHQSRYHVMLINWEEGRHGLVAKRVGGGITHIHRDEWATAGPTRKEIVLG